MAATATGRLSDFLVVTRAKLLIGSFAHAVLGLLLAAPDLGELLSPEAGLFVMMHYSIAMLGCCLNSLCDRDVDRLYKRELSDAVDRLGPSRVRTAIAVEGLVAVSAIVIFLAMGRWVTALAAVLGLAAAVGYSAEPIRMKRRGVWSPIPLWLGLYCLPTIGGWSVFSDRYPAGFFVFLAGYAVMNQGITFINTAEGHAEDAMVGIRTWTHVFGLERVVRLAPVMTAVGIMCPIGIYMIRDSRNPAFLFLLAVATAAILYVAWEVAEVSRADDPESASKQMGPRLAVWFILARYPLVAACLVGYLG